MGTPLEWFSREIPDDAGLPMKLIGSLTSPYVRKVRVVMAEKKLDYQLVLEDVYASDAILKANPLGKVPCLVMEGGEAIFDSRVIVEYLDTLSPVGKLIPASGRERVEVRTSMRSRPGGGISLPTGLSVSRYSTMTRESNTASPPSITRQGTLPSGLDFSTASVPHTSSSTNWKSSFFSTITTRTLRT